MFKKLLSIGLTLFIGFTGITKASMPRYKEGELLVRFAPKEDGEQRTAAEKSQILSLINGGTIKQSYKLIPGLCLVKLPANLTVKNAEELFKNRKDIIYAHPNHLVQAHSTIPDDPNYLQQWAMPKIQAPQAWDKRTGSEIIVAVIDSGVDYLHPDLMGNMWINPGEDHPPLGVVGPEDFDGINDDGNYDNQGNPLIDDIYGYDFCTWNQVWDSDPMDDMGHGTHVTGIIGAIGNNNEGITGTCWSVKVMALKLLGAWGHLSVGWESDAVNCVEYAIDNGAKIINASWRIDDYSESLEIAIDNANAVGVLFVAGAGNSGASNAIYPARYNCENIISVMSTDQNDIRSNHYPDWVSNYGATSVDLAAPGSYIFSTLPTYETYFMQAYGLSNYYDIGSGTSMAAPHVAGACALVWPRYPYLTHLEVKDIIMDSNDRLTSLNGLCVTGGRLNLYKAVTWLSPLALTKTDNADAGGVKPNDQLIYTIDYSFPDNLPNWTNNLTNVLLTSQLPAEVTLDSASGTYTYANHIVSWNLGTLSPGSSGRVTVTVIVGSTRPPTGNLINTAKIISTQTEEVSIELLTPWGPKVYNVNKNTW